MTPPEPDPRRWKALAVSLAAGFMGLLDVNIVNIVNTALPMTTVGEAGCSIRVTPVESPWCHSEQPGRPYGAFTAVSWLPTVVFLSIARGWSDWPERPW